MSIIVELVGGAGDPIVVPIDTTHPVAALVAAVHAALALPRGIDDYEITTPDGADITQHGRVRLEDVGIVGCEERLVVGVRHRVLANERLRAAGFDPDDPRTAARVLQQTEDAARATCMRDLIAVVGTSGKKEVEKAFAQCQRGALQAGDFETAAGLFMLAGELGFWGVESPMTLAVEEGDAEGVRRLIARGVHARQHADRGGHPLLAAVYVMDMAIVELLLEHGTDANARFIAGDPTSDTALLAATGHAGITALLLDHGADVHATGRRGETALCRAVMKSVTATAELLVAHGARTQALDGREWGPEEALLIDDLRRMEVDRAEGGGSMRLHNREMRAACGGVL